MNYSRALQYFFSFINFERLPFEYVREFNLQRMECLLSWFDKPQKSFPSVLIAGTKGKGSTANFLSAILSANRYKTGLYTSPHLTDPRERIQINGKSISKPDFARLIQKIKRVIELHRKKAHSLGPITFFEIFTLLAILYFKEKKVGLGIFEVGMGGRLDATNVLHPLINVITSISYDHQEHLGQTLSLIAREKAATIKDALPIVVGKQKPAALKVIQNYANRRQATCFVYGEDFKVSHVALYKTGVKFDLEFRMSSPKAFIGDPVLDSRLKRAGMTYGMRGVCTSMTGTFQIENASIALAVSYLLKEEFHFNLNEPLIRKALKEAFWPGRFEVVKRNGQTIILDGAHNGASMKQLTETVNLLYPHRRKVFLLGTSREKNLDHILKPLIPAASLMILTKSDNIRAQEPKLIIEHLNNMGFHKPTFMASKLSLALKMAETVSSKDDILIVTGSLFLVGEARSILKCRTFV